MYTPFFNVVKNALYNTVEIYYWLKLKIRSEWRKNTFLIQYQISIELQCYYRKLSITRISSVFSTSIDQYSSYRETTV